MTITLLCAGALALPGATDARSDSDTPIEAVRAKILARLSLPGDGPAARLLARARAPRQVRDDALVPFELPDEAWLRERFAPEDSASIAAYAACAADEDGSEPQLLLRPVHLHAGLDHAVLALPQADEIGEDEAGALIDSANRLIGEDGLALAAPSTGAWILRATSDAGRERLAGFAALRCRSARLVAGRDIEAWQPQGTAARAWRGFSNELQMLWFEHPVNEARERAGRPTLNSVWLDGRPGAVGRRAFDAVITSDDSVAGLALAAGSEVSALPAQASPEDFVRVFAIQEAAETILIDPGWWRAAVTRADAPAWLDGWHRLDALVERLNAAHFPIEQIVLSGERDLLDFAPRPADRWAMWRRRELAGLLSTHR